MFIRLSASVFLTLLLLTVRAGRTEEDKTSLTFDQYQALFDKGYSSKAQWEEAKLTYQTNIKQIKKHNALFREGHSSYREGVNQFTGTTTTTSSILLDML